MRKFNLFVLCFAFLASSFAQSRKACDKSIVDKTYSYSAIHGSLRALINKTPQEKFFDDDFFNDLLKGILEDPQFSDKEKVQLFYLMQKKIGFAFSGIAYLPPKQNYFMNHNGRIYTFQKTRAALKNVGATAKTFLNIAETYRVSDAILAGNAFLLATLISPDSVLNKLETYSQESVIKQSKNPNVFNHYVCLSASLIQDSVIVKNLIQDLEKTVSAEMKEDCLCALYSKVNPLSSIKQFILKEKEIKNALAIQTALCVIYDKVPEASYETSLKDILKSISEKEKWKKDILKNMLDKKYSFNYSLANNDKIVTKVWDGVTAQQFANGLLISNGALTEFDEN